MKILRRDEAIHVAKPDGTIVTYYIMSEYEIHFDHIPAGVIQDWHHHECVEETLLVLSGELTIHWIDESGRQVVRVGVGDVVRVEHWSHAIANHTNQPATFVVFRLILKGTDDRAAIRADKVLDTPLPPATP